MNKPDIRIARVYNPPAHKEGLWLLIDRLWPRGIKKESIPFDSWLKEIAPSTELRKWFHHEPDKWPEFKERYVDELADKQELVNEIKKMAMKSPVTLFYSAKDTEHNQALVLQEILTR
ncbi:hypothetical protein BN59_02746 [Legionella massiliensis]|uniref:Uroporphyrin-III C-methyltransferase n=1 Tax=Legionella massiliensis TaxID=1034943 RepID=A0A078KZZ4_9GAMM|nr:DUF488 family protein [Legionella massiliensis]CDZ78436.1 hypothetical protein BN59_02746 [Legionella massiliensis]CEE14174.1 hypothetical protein BN1094_02746 [Legionella massiliensis]